MVLQTVRKAKSGGQGNPISKTARRYEKEIQLIFTLDRERIVVLRRSIGCREERARPQKRGARATLLHAD